MSDEAGPLLDPLPWGNQPIFRCAVLEAGRNRGLSIAQRSFEHHQGRSTVGAQCRLAIGLREEQCPGPAKGVVGAFGQLVLLARPNLLERAEGLRERVGRCDVTADRGGGAKPLNSAFRSGRALLSHAAALVPPSLRAA